MFAVRIRFLVVILLAVVIVSCATQDTSSTQNPSKTVVLVSGANEYFTNISLRNYEQYLQKQHPEFNVIRLQATGNINEKDEYDDIPGLEILQYADVALFFVRRTTIDGEQLRYVKEFANSGKGIVALRTASHGFQNWLEFDNVVLGGNYHMHYTGTPESPQIDCDTGVRHPTGSPVGPTLQLEVNQEFSDHPILDGVEDRWTSPYSLYRMSPVADDVSVLFTGTNSQGDGPEPVAWVRNYKGARIFFAALGGLQDWENENFVNMVTNAIVWAAR